MGVVGGLGLFEPISPVSWYNRCRTKSSKSPPPPPSPRPLGTPRPNKSQSRRLRPNCREPRESTDNDIGAVDDWVSSPSADPYQILGLDPASCSPPHLKSAFRARVKEFHPDVCKDKKNSDAIIRRIIKAYEILSKSHQDKSTEGPCLDPFEEPECEAYDLFVNEVLCVGKGCPYSCVKEAPRAFSFTSENGTAYAISQGHGDDYLVQLAVGRCPRRCIHYVTPAQRVILEDLLNNVLNAPYDLAEAALLDFLISKATLENKRYQKPKRQPKVSTAHVDWC